MENFYRSIKKRRCFLFVFFLSAFVSLNAQKVNWETGFPKITPETLGTLGDPGVLEFKFIVTENDAASGKIVVELPVGLTYQSVTAGAENKVTYTPTVSGNKVALAITSDGGKLLVGKMVHIRMNIGADCVESNLTIKIDVQSNNASITDGVRNIVVKVERPVIRIIPVNAKLESMVIGADLQYDLKLDVSNGLKAGSFKIIFQKDKYTNLKDFKLDGVAVAHVVTSISTLKDNVTVTLTNVNLEAVVKHLTFKANSSYGGSRTVTSQIQFTNNGGVACGAIANGPEITLVNPTIAGSPTLRHDQARWVAPTAMDGAGLSATGGICMNGIDYSYLRVQYTNTGTAATKQITPILNYIRSPIYALGYIEMSKIYYSVDGGATKILLTSDRITKSNALATDNGYRLLKPEVNGADNVNQKYYGATFTINEPLAAGAGLVIYWPIIQGDIYNNETYHPTVSSATSPWASIQWGSYNISAIDANANPVGVPTNTYGAGGIAIPRFISSPVPVSLREGDSNASTFYIDSGTADASANQTTDIFIKFPDWIEFTAAKNGSTTLTPLTKDETKNLYSFRLPGSGARNFTVIYKAKSGKCLGVNQKAEIEYWLNYNLGGNNTNLRPVLKQIGKIFQPVTLLCKEEGFVMENFKLKRTTKGLKDSNQNYVPDSDTPALDSEILHNVYLRSDKGEMIITGKIGAGSYNHLYTLLTGTGIQLSQLNLQASTIQVGSGAKESVAVTKVDDYRYYIGYNKSLTTNNIVTITIPFHATTAGNDTKAIGAECYVTALPVTAPFTPGAGRVGEDDMYQSITVYGDGHGRDGSAVIFTDNVIRPEFQHGYFDNYHGNNFQSPYFEKEYRTVGEITQFTISLPPGYRITEPNDQLKLRNTVGPKDSHATANPTLYMPATSREDKLDGTTVLTYDLTTLFDGSCKSEAAYALLPATKWIYPDDRFNYQFISSLQATKGAVSKGEIVTSLRYRNATNNNVLTNMGHTIGTSYTGDRTSIAVSTNTLTAYGKTFTIPTVTPGNVANKLVRMWLYVVGNGKNSSVRKSDGTVINGVGINGSWIPLGTFTANSTNNYAVSYTLNSINCVGENIQIYTMSDFGDAAWNPTITAPIDLNDIDHLGAMTYVTVKASDAIIDGTVTTDPALKLQYNTPYTTTAELNGSSSEGNLTGAQMVITVPAGQKYVPGSAKYIYPFGSAPQAIPAAVETALVNALGKDDATLNNARTYTFKVSDFIAGDELPGYRLASNDNDRRIQLKMDFTPLCATSLMGIRFSGILKGKNICGKDTFGNNKDIRSGVIFSNVSSDYLFKVTSAMASGVNAFNEVKKEDQMTVKLENYFGNVGLMAATDYLLITMHKSVNINTASPITIGSTAIPELNAQTMAVQSNSVLGDVRSVHLELPVAILNTLGTAVLNKDFTYSVPLVYTANAQTLANTPEHTLETTVVTYKKFAPTCPATPMPIGSTSLDIALLTAKENPVGATVGIAKALEITSTGFVGKWYADKTTSTVLSGAAIYNYTPTVKTDATFYVSAEFGSKNYGRVPVLVKVYPGLAFTVANATICYGESIDLSTLVSGQAGGVTIKYYETAAATIPLASSIVSPTASKTYYVQSSNDNGDKSEAKPVIITVRPQFVVGNIAGNPFVCKDAVAQTIVGQVSTGGSNTITYQWYKSTDGIAWEIITGATAKDYSPGVLTQNAVSFKRVSIDASCGEFDSNIFKITVVPNTNSVLYWKANAGSNNWYDSNNWTNAGGGAVSYFPLSCTEVHIPGNATKYPSLENSLAGSPQESFGAPTCEKIIFHFGGQIAYPHNLKYEKAYVHYNWGHYNNGSYPAGIVNKDANSATPIGRDKWYMLAAPLKNIVSGDFAFAGYPVTYQALYNVTNPVSGALLEGQFTKEIPTNDVQMAKTNNAIAIKVGGYHAETGKNNHRDLDKLEGILEIPYFENSAVAPFHSGHDYDNIAKKSYFYYFDNKTLQKVHSPVGTLARDSKSYRFVYEGSNDKLDPINVNGQNVPAYAITVTSGTSSSKSVMIGNPFMSSINAEQFYNANAGKLKKAEGYRIYNNSTSVFDRFDYSSTNNISPLQSFVVTLDNVTSAELVFPLEGQNALTGANYKGSLRMAPAGTALFMRAGLGNKFDSDYAVLNVDELENTVSTAGDVQMIVSTDNDKTPEIFLIGDGAYNLIQNIPTAMSEVGVGVRSANTQDLLTMEFANISEFVSDHNLRPILVDKLLGLKQDLTADNTYHFYQQKVESSKQYADMSRFAIRLADADDTANSEDGVRVIYTNNQLEVVSDSEISQVMVYDLRGIQVHNSGQMNTMTTTYKKSLPLATGVYVVKVKTVKQDVSKKIIAK